MTAEQRMEIDRVRALWATAPVSSGIGTVSAFIGFLVFYAQEGLATMLVYFAVTVSNQLVRVALYRLYSRESDDPARTALWARRYTWTMVAGGIIWSTFSVMFFRSDDAARQVYILVAAFGNTAGATAPNAYHPPAMIWFIVTTLLPIMSRVFMEGGLVYGIVGVALLMQMGLMILFGLNMTKVLLASIRMRYENAQLVEELRHKTEIAQDARQKAEQASLAKSQFFAAASHDLRQPLQALGLYAASLREARRDTEDARRVSQILASVDALESLFDELLDISKLDAGYVKPAPAHFHARGVFERLESAYLPLARKNGLELRFEDGGAVLHTDAILIERVLGNFIGNALRYTEAGSVSVRCRAQGGCVVLEVADTGPGIPREEHERVFEEFYQLGNPERDRRKGLGLGLATVRRIAQLLGSRVTLESEPGRGSVFAIEVPAGDAAQVPLTPKMPAVAEVDALRGKVICVIDDERDIREGLADLLTQWRCVPVVAASAGELFDQLDSAGARPDVLIADYRLREHETGIAAIADLRTRFGASLPALMMSGDTSSDMFRLAREQRVPLLSKPVRASRLRAALQHLLSDALLPAGTAPPT
ncbi:MAG: hybrid sensor histidine kinase/response regulator [Candidatus Parcubacteria bacterium]|nr:hybrid sensor histidine kinase/response regulator [Burkholderiales bacterium]